MERVYRVGVIGTAWAARSPLPTFRDHRRTEIAAVCSARLERARATADQFGAPLAYDDYRTMIAEADLDIVYIGSPVYLHREMVLAAAEAGKHVLCEKPLAKNATEGRDMVEAMDSRGLAHACAFTMRNFPPSLYAKKLIDEGFVGDIRHINAAMWRGFPSTGALRPWTWLNDSTLGGGFLGAMGSHYLDLVRMFAGEYRNVFGRTRTWERQAIGDDGQPREITAEDSLVILAELAEGGIASISFSSAIRSGTGRRVEIYGSKGSIVMDGDDQLRLAGPGDADLKPVDLAAIPLPESVRNVAVPRFGMVIDSLIAEIEGGPKASPNLYDGLRCQLAQDAVQESQRLGCAVDLPQT